MTLQSVIDYLGELGLGRRGFPLEWKEAGDLHQPPCQQANDGAAGPAVCQEGDPPLWNALSVCNFF